jgi:pimeloyl-ACP methyl ester carboxylesterase
MAANYIIERACSKSLTCQLAFAGDGVRLAGQLDYPKANHQAGQGAPLIFILPHAGWPTRQHYQYYARIALNIGYAVFRWDRRGTGESGAGGWGNPTQDVLNAYETALEQPGINRHKSVIFAQAESTLILAENFGLFARIAQPSGVLLASNRLDSKTIIGINAPLFIVQGERDWYQSEKYARSAAQTHNETFTHGAQYYIAPDADHDMMVAQGENSVFHLGAVHKIQDWLQSL